MNQTKKLNPGFIVTRNQDGKTYIHSRNINLKDCWVILKRCIYKTQEKILHLAITNRARMVR